MHQVQMGTHKPSKRDAELQHAQSATLGGANRGVNVPLLSSSMENPFPSVFYMQPFSIVVFKGKTEHGSSQGCSNVHRWYSDAVQVP